MNKHNLSDMLDPNYFSNAIGDFAKENDIYDIEYLAIHMTQADLIKAKIVMKRTYPDIEFTDINGRDMYGKIFDSIILILDYDIHGEILITMSDYEIRQEIFGGE